MSSPPLFGKCEIKIFRTRNDYETNNIGQSVLHIRFCEVERESMNLIYLCAGYNRAYSYYIIYIIFRGNAFVNGQWIYESSREIFSRLISIFDSVNPKSRIKNRFESMTTDGVIRQIIINRYYACIARAARDLRGVRFILLETHLNNNII